MAATYSGEKLPVVILIPRSTPFDFPVDPNVILAYETGGKLLFSDSFLLLSKTIEKT
jgi:hypothetical protein